ncbi:MAG: SPOR domain-containing protein [Magnetococcales bacterium]|nr:SPOR domain-containing protein [Magnetococcales bacterium]
METGTKIDGGRYVVRRPFGRWALGSVSLVEERGTGQTMVMRSLPDIFSSAEGEFFQKFEKTIAELLKLSPHPGIVPPVGHVFDTTQKRRFLLSRFVEGKPLADVRAAHPGGMVPPHEALELARKIAIVLNHAHLEGVCHRNLNPGNVIVLADGEVRLVNFGLAYALRALAWSRGVDFDQKILQEQVPYASPEQYVVKSAGRGGVRDTLLFAEHGGARFLGQTPDSGGDIYALAVMFHEMVAGKTPFSDDDRLALSAARWHNEGPVLRPLPMLSDSQNMILERALHWDPRQRLASAMAFIHAMTPSPEELAAGSQPGSTGESATALADPSGQSSATPLVEEVSGQLDEPVLDDRARTRPQMPAVGGVSRPAERSRERSTAPASPSGRSAASAQEAVWYQGSDPVLETDLAADQQAHVVAGDVSGRKRRGGFAWVWAVSGVVGLLAVLAVVWWLVGDDGPVVDVSTSSIEAEGVEPRQPAARADRIDGLAATPGLKPSGDADVLAPAGRVGGSPGVGGAVTAGTATLGDAPMGAGGGSTEPAEGSEKPVSARERINPPASGSAAGGVSPGLSEETAQPLDVLRERLTRAEERMRSAQLVGGGKAESDEESRAGRLVGSLPSEGDDRRPMPEVGAQTPRVADILTRVFPSASDAAGVASRAPRAGGGTGDVEARPPRLPVAADAGDGSAARVPRTPAVGVAGAPEGGVPTPRSGGEKVATAEGRLPSTPVQREGGGAPAKGTAVASVTGGSAASSGKRGEQFALQLDSFSTEGEAEALVQRVAGIRLSDRPLPVASRLVRMGSVSWYRVAVAPLATRQEAEGVAKVLRDRLGVSGFIVLVDR